MAAILAVSVGTVDRQQLEIQRLNEHIKEKKRKVHPVPMGIQYQGGTILLLASIAKRLDERRRKETTDATSTCERTKTDKFGKNGLWRRKE